MTKVSKYKLDKNLQAEMLKQFWYALGKINNSYKASNFFNNFLTESEKIMLSKRFTAAILVIRNKTPSEIHSAINLSYSAICSVVGWVKNADVKTKDILNEVSKDKNIESVFDLFETIIDSTAPRRHSDWVVKYKKRKIRENQRMIRKSLR